MGNLLVRYCRHFDNQLGDWIFWLSCRWHHSCFTGNSHYRVSSKGYQKGCNLIYAVL